MHMRSSAVFTRLFTLFICVCLTTSGLFAQKSVTGNGNLKEENRSLSGFSAIEVSNGVDVFLSQGSTERVVVKADENLLDHVVTEVEGNVLKITTKGSIRKAKALDVYVTVSTLDRIKASSGSDVKTESALKVNALVVRMMAGSDLDMEINANELTCNLSSGSDADLSGKVGTLVIEANGGSDIEAKNLEANKCTIKASGGSDAHVHVTGDLEMEAYGASDISYSGNPNIVSSKASGGSDIHGN